MVCHKHFLNMDIRHFSQKSAQVNAATATMTTSNVNAFVMQTTNQIRKTKKMVNFPRALETGQKSNASRI
jgi:hypothetical protein